MGLSAQSSQSEGGGNTQAGLTESIATGEGRMWQKETVGGLGLKQRFLKSKPHSEKEKEYQVSSQTRSGQI